MLLTDKEVKYIGSLSFFIHDLEVQAFLVLETFFLRISKLFYPNINTKLGTGKDYNSPFTIIDFNT